MSGGKEGCWCGLQLGLGEVFSGLRASMEMIDPMFTQAPGVGDDSLTFTDIAEGCRPQPQ